MTPADIQQLIDFTYIAAAIGFILAIKWLGSPVTAKRGVLVGEIARDNDLPQSLVHRQMP